MYNTLARSPLFSGLNEGQVQDLFTKVVYQVRSYAKGDVIATGGEECRVLQIVLQGSVKGEMIDYSGRVLKIEDIGVPRPLAIAFLFGENNRCPVTISANEYTELLVLSKISVVTLMQSSEVFLTNFLNAVSNRAQFISSKLRFLSFKTIRGKLAHFLLELDRRQNANGEIVLDKTQEELADLFGVARPSLSRSLRELHHEGVIDAKKQRVVIVDRERLMAELQE
ncbi:MAG: Crp/Fnr family transcriptional regulator [Marinilabiliaceae bacterium]